jgi:oxygen-independent coproporphyrinogen-3 oxidase
MTDTTAVRPPGGAAPGAARHRPPRHATARYAIYPTEEHFNGRFGSTELMAALSRRRVASQTVCTPLAVHIRIPFHGARHHPLIAQAAAGHRERVVPYLEALEREVTLVVEQIGACRTVARLHVGGDSPGCLGDADLARLMGLLRRNFHVEQDAEVAIEVDPATIDARRLAHLRDLGFDHVVMTVPDAAQDALDPLADLVATARGLAFTSIDVELAGDAWLAARPLAAVATLQADRISLPAPVSGDGAGRAAFGAEAQSCLAAAGYEAIGMGQFARRADALVVARHEGRLHMTLQGYRARPDDDVLGLGVAAIGRIGNCLYQNARTLAAYHGALEDDRLPVTHGHVVDADDELQREVIQALMTQGRVAFSDVLARRGVDMRTAFATELARLAPFVARGLVELHGDRIELTPGGRYVADEIAAVFDRYLHERAVPAQPAGTGR